MTQILSVGTSLPPHRVDQDEVMAFVGGFFRESYPDIDRLLKVFHNGQIQSRHLSVPLEWFNTKHSLQEKNDLYIKISVELGIEAIRHCLNDSGFWERDIHYEEVDAIFYVSTTGFSTPSIEAK
ncbi:MAG TPA: type III polyketide synthase, partial [Bacillales bacterium]